MSFLNNMSIRMKIIVLLMAPVLGLVYFSANTVIEKTRLSHELHLIEQLAELAVEVSAFVHEAQKERGMTGGFLGSKGKSFANVLPTQRKNVDEKKVIFQNHLKEFNRELFTKGFNRQLDVSLKLLAKLSGMRSKISSQSVTGTEAIDYFTKMNGEFIHLISDMSKLTNDGLIARNIIAYDNYLLAKEKAGVERAILTNTFSRNSFPPGMYNKFNRLVYEQENFIEVFLTLANKEAVEKYKSTIHGIHVENVNKMRSIAFKKANQGDFGVDSTFWYESITAKINLLKDVEDWLSDELITSLKESDHKANIEKILYIIIAFVATALALLMAFVVSKNITSTLNQTLFALKDIAEGEGDLTRRLAENGHDEIAQVAAAFNKFSEKIEHMVAEIKNAATSIDISSNEIAKGNFDLSQRTEEQASSLEETASSMEEMTSTVKQNADNAHQAKQLAMDTSEAAEKGGKVLHKAVDAMAEISTSSKEIADIISVIDEIAFQTNLLALNAAVEAARAGEQGRGFAVVASEVRSLAGRSADAAKEIKELISDSVNKVEMGSKLVDESGQTLEEIVDGVKQVTDIISEIAASSQEQASGIEQVNNAVIQMDEMTQQNAALVEEGSAASFSMTEQCQSLSQMVAQFKVTDIRSSNLNSMISRTKRSVVTTSAPLQRKVKTKAKVNQVEAVKDVRKPVASTQTKETNSIDDNSEWDEF